ncbi:hypothetical protein ACLOJK_003555 [Asimina triloba]
MTASVAVEMEMEPRIWSRLPDHLLERILALLPLKTFFNLRTTCKRFHSLLFSPSFLSHTHPSPTFSPYLLLSHPHLPPAAFLLHHVFHDRWRTLALSHSLPLTCAPSPTLLSASGGLLCFSLPDSFFVCNVLTRSAKSIEFPTCPFESVSLIPTSTPFSSSPSSVHGYKLLLLCSSSQSANRVLVYDSATEKWARFDGYDPIPTQNSHQEAVFFDGSLHFATREPFLIVGFDVRSGRWRESAAELPQSLVFVRLVSSGNRKDGNLYLVGGIGRDGISKRLKVWELTGGGGSGEWEEVAPLPELMCRKFGSVCYHNYEHVYCLWHEGSICICCYTWPEILVYKVGRKTWHWLPRCPLLPEKWSCGFRWFSYSPDLYALV